MRIISTLICDARLVFNADKTITLNITSKFKFVHTSLVLNQFIEYYYNSEEIGAPSMSVGINMQNLFKTLKAERKKTATIDFYILTSDIDDIHIVIDNMDTIRSTDEYSFAAVNQDIPLSTLGVSDYKCNVKFNSTILKQVLTSFKYLGVKKLDIAYSQARALSDGDEANARLIFSFSDKSGVEVSNTKTYHHSLTSPAAKSPIPTTLASCTVPGPYTVSEPFLLDQLAKFASCPSDNSIVTIYIGPQMPYVFEYVIGSMGHIRFSVSPYEA
jgi:hypothetical protein